MGSPPGGTLRPSSAPLRYATLRYATLRYATLRCAALRSASGGLQLRHPAFHIPCPHNPSHTTHIHQLLHPTTNNNLGREPIQNPQNNLLNLVSPEFAQVLGKRLDPRSVALVVGCVRCCSFRSVLARDRRFRAPHRRRRPVLQRVLERGLEPIHQRKQVEAWSQNLVRTARRRRR